MVKFTEGRNALIVLWFLTAELRLSYDKLPGEASGQKRDLVARETQDNKVLFLWNEPGEFPPFWRLKFHIPCICHGAPADLYDCRRQQSG